MKKTDIGGQAVIEGVMMRGHNSIATAVRCGNDIIVKKDMAKPLTKKYKILSVPFIRGTVALIDSLIIGIKTLTYSAELVEGESEEEPSKFEFFLKRVFGDKLDDVIMYFSVALSLAISVIIFFIGPTYV
ncbi:MAG: hypothetical protein PWQ59_1548, partial [Thermoanaerobacterium sp.]|nr:hypothetical protein [Thermoanaerobacterium sp.]